MKTKAQFSGLGWFALIVVNVLHWLVLLGCGAVAMLALLMFLTFDMDHRAARARFDEIIAVWTAERVTDVTDKKANAVVKGLGK